MAFFEWHEEFSVHVQEIDQQHKRIIEMINDVQAALFENACLEAQRKVVNEMIDYSAVHFLTEEKYMEQFSYSLIAEHIAEHDKFRVKSKELKQKMQIQGYLMSMELIAYLKNWWKNHILITDMKYSQSFNQHGLK